jgi:hypothetical protein
LWWFKFSVEISFFSRVLVMLFWGEAGESS